MKAFAAIAAIAALTALPAPAGAAESFAGAYAGFNAGIAWGSSDYATEPGCAPAGTNGTFCESGSPSTANGTAVAAAGRGTLSSDGFTGGAQAGYAWQSGTLVYGGEADAGALDLGKSALASGLFPFVFLGDRYTVTSKISTDWFATLRGRVGVTATPRLLLYATGGVAFTTLKVSASYADNAVDPTFPGGTGAARKSSFRAGWTLGGGGEWLLNDRWSLKAEYLYVDFGEATVAVLATNTADFSQTMRTEGGLTAHILRAGINYRF